MKTALLLSLTALSTPVHAASPALPTERMAQFLEQKATLELELNVWKQSAAGQFAKQNRLFPTATDETKTAEAAGDDELRRFFLTKLLIEEAQAANPEALFSTDSPFTLMTKEEFVTFMGTPYQRGENLLTATATADVITNATETLSAEKDWTTSGCVVDAKTQGQCGSCWVFAAVAALESAMCIAGQPLASLSEQQVLSGDLASYGCQGGYPADALEFVQQAGGVCREADYPYVSGSTGDRGSCESNSCTMQAVTIQKVVEVPQSESGLLRALDGRPVAVGVAAGNPTWKQYSSGVVSSCTSSQLDHAVLAVGFGSGEGERSSPFFKIKNSWGTSWGENGYMRLKRGAGTEPSGTCGIIGPKSVFPQL